MVRILQEPKNALVNQYKYLFNIDDVDLDFRTEALVEIAKKALQRKTGARGLRSILEELLMDTMFELPNIDLEKVIVDFIKRTLLRLRFNLRTRNLHGYHLKLYWQYKSTCQIINSIVSGGDNYENHRRSHPTR